MTALAFTYSRNPDYLTGTYTAMLPEPIEVREAPDLPLTTADRVLVWYDARSRNWVVYLGDKLGQIGGSRYVYTKVEAMAAAEDLAAGR